MLGELNPCGGGDPIPLDKPRMLIGRGDACDIVLRFPNVSTKHCELELVGGYWMIRDLDSRNGIKVNHERCQKKCLMPGDVLTVAKHSFDVNYQPATDQPPPQEENPFELSLMEKAGLMARKPKK